MLSSQLITNAAASVLGVLLSLTLAAFPAHDQVLLVQCESRLDGARFEELVRAALRGTRQVADLMQAQVREHTKLLAGAKLALLR